MGQESVAMFSVGDSVYPSIPDMNIINRTPC